MNHLYQFTNDANPWAAISVSVSTGGMPGAACVVIRKGSTRLQTYYTPSELRFIAAGYLEAADALEQTARELNDEYLDREAV